MGPAIAIADPRVPGWSGTGSNCRKSERVYKVFSQTKAPLDWAVESRGRVAYHGTRAHVHTHNRRRGGSHPPQVDAIAREGQPWDRRKLHSGRVPLLLYGVAVANLPQGSLAW